MNVKLLLKAAVLAATIMMGLNSQSQPNLSTRAEFDDVYEKWQRVFEDNPILGDGQFFAEYDGLPVALRQSVKSLKEFGPNVTPFLIEKLRAETDAMRIYRAVLLLDRIGGINLYWGRDDAKPHPSAMKDYRDEFIKQWDSKIFEAPDQAIERLWSKRRVTVGKPIDPKSLAEVRRFGVYSLPFLIREVRTKNSPDAFAAFLIITGERLVYADYIESADEMFVTQQQKNARIDDWHQKNSTKFSNLKSMNERLRQAIMIEK